MRAARAIARLSVAITLALAGALALGGAAEAKSLTVKRGIVTRTATATASGNQAIVTATAVCPKKTRAVGGGFVLPSPSSGFLPFIYESVKVGQRAWRASAQIADSSAPDGVTLLVSAYCRGGQPKTSTVTSTVPTPVPAQIGPATSAICPSNQRLVGGGFAIPAPVVGTAPKNFVIRSEPTGNSWTSEVISATGTSTLTSLAYCVKKKAIVASLPVKATTPGTTTPPTRTTTTATCAGQRTITGGGFSQAASLGMGGGYYFVLEAGRSGKSWLASGAQVGPSTATSLSSVGLCSPKRLSR